MLCNCVHLRAMRAVQLSAVCTLCKHVMCKIFLECATFVHCVSRSLVHNCTIFLYSLDVRNDDPYRNPNMNNKDHRVG